MTVEKKMMKKKKKKNEIYIYEDERNNGAFIWDGWRDYLPCCIEADRISSVE